MLISAVLLTGSLLLGAAIWHVSDQDVEIYRQLLASSSPTEKPMISYSEQLREGVCKEIWYQEGDTPLYYRIESDDSELFFFHQNGQIEVVEQLSGVHCIMQEKLYFEKEQPMQLIRYMKAENATYNYNTQLFVAEDAHIWRFRIEGHEPVQSIVGLSPLMEGEAETVEFTIKGKQLDFSAHRFRAKVNEELL